MRQIWPKNWLKKAVLQDTGDKTPLKTPLKTDPENAPENDPKTPVKILKTLAESPNMTTLPELAKVIDRSASATKRAVRRLRQFGVI